jgi:hypothetical protein
VGCLSVLEAAIADIGGVLADLDPACLAGTDAAALTDCFALGERLCAAGKALTARRVAEVGVWRAAGERSPAHWLARRSGTTVAAAAAALETAERIEDLARVDRAYRAGTLSQVKTQEIASSSSVDPAAQTELLAVAAGQGVKGLRDACRAAGAAAVDECARYQAVHRSRYLRSWVDADGAGRLDARLTTDALAVVLAGLEHFEGLEFAAARDQGRREPYHACSADALVATALAMAASARAVISSISSGWPPASPTLRVTAKPASVCRQGLAFMAATMASARRDATTRSVSARTSANSSPPRRTARSPGRMLAVRMAARRTSVSSPALWP